MLFVQFLNKHTIISDFEKFPVVFIAFFCDSRECIDMVRN